MKSIVRLAVLVVCAYLSGFRFWDFFGPQWYFGVFFGAVVVVWEAKRPADVAALRSIAFVIASLGLHFVALDIGFWVYDAFSYCEEIAAEIAVPMRFLSTLLPLTQSLLLGIHLTQVTPRSCG